MPHKENLFTSSKDKSKKISMTIDKTSCNGKNLYEADRNVKKKLYHHLGKNKKMETDLKNLDSINKTYGKRKKKDSFSTPAHIQNGGVTYLYNNNHETKPNSNNMTDNFIKNDGTRSSKIPRESPNRKTPLTVSVKFFETLICCVKFKKIVASRRNSSSEIKIRNVTCKFNNNEHIKSTANAQSRSVIVSGYSKRNRSLPNSNSVNQNVSSEHPVDDRSRYSISNYNNDQTYPPRTIHISSSIPANQSYLINYAPEISLDLKKNDLIYSVSETNQNNHLTLNSNYNGNVYYYDDYKEGLQDNLLPSANTMDINKLCMVIDLDETLVHSSFKPVENADYVIPVNIDNTIHQVYVLKRPHVDTFLLKISRLFECVLFTASLAKYADPVADLLDAEGEFFRARLFRDACVFHQGNYVKDLNRLGRNTDKVIIIDNSPASYIFQPQNAIPITSWFGDENDRELLELIPLLERIVKEKEALKVISEHKKQLLC